MIYKSIEINNNNLVFMQVFPYIFFFLLTQKLQLQGLSAYNYHSNNLFINYNYTALSMYFVCFDLIAFIGKINFLC